MLWLTLDKLGPLTTGINATDMAPSFSDMVLSTVTDFTPPKKRQGGRQKSCATAEAQENVSTA